MNMFENPQATGTKSSPIGNFPELWNMYNFVSGGNQSAGLADVAGRRATNDTNVAEQSANISRQKRVSEIKELLDPKNFQRVQKEDGGYDYYDPSGNKITVEDYSKYTGETKAKALEGSMNLQDINFLKDYNTVKNLMDALYNGKQDKVMEIQSQLEDAGIDPNSIMPQDLIKALHNQYGEYWTTTEEKIKQEQEKQNNPGLLKKLFSAFGNLGGGGE